MKILLLSWNYPPARGGIEYVVENLYQGLRRAGNDVHVLTSYAEGAEPDVRVHRCPRRGLKPYVVYSLVGAARLLRQWRADVIVCGSLVAAPAAYVLSRWFSVPYAVLVHGSDLLRPGTIYQSAMRFLLRRADLICANSTRVKQILLNEGLGTGKIRVLHPGVRVEDYACEPVGAAQEILDAARGRRVILSVGRLIKRKGALELVTEVMPQLAREMPDVLLLIVGDDATRSLVHAERMRDVIARRIAELGLSNHVRLLGTLPDDEVVRLMFRADVFVMPCLDLPGDVEGFGIVLLEAALAGTPAVATRVGGIVEAVVDGETGLLVQAGDWTAVATAIRSILKDDALRQRLATRAAERARREFSWEIVVQRYVEALSNVIH
jgi:phosphatidyl-myo-inositol dimannoside synthase